MKTKRQLVQCAVELLNKEHPGCNDNTCSINDTVMQEFPMIAMEEFASSGAASAKFQRVYAEFKSKFKAPHKYLKRECFRFCRSIPSMECNACGAFVRDFDRVYSDNDDVWCDSCANVLTWKGSTE